MELKKGMRVTCIIAGTTINDAVIQVECGFYYICQNKRKGGGCEDTKGYKYSWFAGSTVDNIGEHDVSCLRIVSSDIENVQEGDIIGKDGYKRKVLGRCGEVVFRSRFDQLDRCDDMVTITQLKNLGYQMEIPQDDTVDITVEGKTKTISRLSAKELNLID